MPGRRRTAAAVLCAATLLTLTGRPAAGQAPASGNGYAELAVMAEFIERFTRFVEWPAQELPPQRPFTICVVEPGGLTAYLRQLVASRPLKGRPAALRLLNGAPEPGQCQLLWLGEQGERLRELGPRLAGRPVLTVAAAPGAASAGAMINFYRDGQYLRFEVNHDAMIDGRLVMRARLLRLARIVGGHGWREVD